MPEHEGVLMKADSGILLSNNSTLASPNMHPALSSRIVISNKAVSEMPKNAHDRVLL